MINQNEDFYIEKKRRRNEQLAFFGSKRFISVYARKPRIRVKVYVDKKRIEMSLGEKLSGLAGGQVQDMISILARQQSALLQNSAHSVHQQLMAAHRDQKYTMNTAGLNNQVGAAVANLHNQLGQGQLVGQFSGLSGQYGQPSIAGLFGGLGMSAASQIGR